MNNGTGYTIHEDPPRPRSKANGGAGAKGTPPHEKGGTPFPFTTFNDARAASAAKSWLFKHLIARGETSAWVGPPGSLKSAILASAAYAAATGQDWCGKRNKGRCAVIYLALERGYLVRRRLRADAERDKATDVPIAVVSRTINFMDPKVVADAVATIDAVEKRFGVKVGLIIIDTLAKAIAAGGGDEDKARDQGMVHANLARIKERRGVHIALACHPGKDPSRGIRGSSSALGDFDIEVTITSDGAIRTATITKNNDGGEGPLASFKPLVHRFGVDEDGEPIEVCLADPLDQPQEPERTKPATKKLSPLGQKFLEAFFNCATVAHEGRQCVAQAAWRHECERLRLIDPDARADSARSLFSKHRRELVAANRVACNGEFSWKI
jgi:hypothetical protein